MHRRHDPTYYWATRRLPRGDAARHARALRLRAHGRPDRRRPAPRRRRRTRAAPRSTPGRPSCSAGCRRRTPQPVVGALVDAGARHRAAARRARHLHALDAGRLRAGADRDAGRSSSPTWTARPARSGGSWRRCSACPSATTPTSAASGWRSSSRTSSATCARTGELDRIYLPAEDRERFGVAEDDLGRRRATPSCARWSPTRCARARALFAGAEPAVAAAPASVRPGIRLACALYLRHARPRRGGRLRRARPPRAACRAWQLPGASRCGAAAMTRRATLRGAERTPLRRRAPTC